MYCDEHLSDGTPRCFICHKFKPAGDIEYLNLGAGLMTCSKCSSIAIKNSEDFKPVIENVHNFYESLNLKVDQEISILLVDGNEMRRSSQGRMLLGSCSRLILRILILSELPDVAMGGTLAHEMMHAWLTLQGCEPWKWERSVEEGICHVMKYEWMKWFFSSSDFDAWYKTNEKAQYARKLKQYIVLLMESSVDEVYGQGFRDAMKVVKQLGLQETLKSIVKTGKLPIVIDLTV